MNLYEQAPYFELENQKREIIKLDDFKGKWLVLYFYPRDNTPGCTIEAIQFSHYIDEFQELNAEVIGISSDTVKSHCNFINKHNLKISLLSDPKHSVARKYGVWKKKSFNDKEYIGVDRSTFIINPEGFIGYIWNNVNVKGHINKVLNKLKEIQDEPDS